MILAIFGLAVFAAGGLQRLWEWGRRSQPLASAWLAGLLLVAVAADLGWESHRWQASATADVPIARPHEPRVRLIGPGSPEVFLVEFTPSRLVYSVESDAGCLMVTNIRWTLHDSWRTGDFEMRSFGGLMGISVPAGRHEVVMTFRTRYWTTGVLLTLFAVIGAALSLFAPRRFTRRILDVGGSALTRL